MALLCAAEFNFLLSFNAGNWFSDRASFVDLSSSLLLILVAYDKTPLFFEVRFQGRKIDNIKTEMTNNGI